MTPATRQNVVKEALSWQGTPYHHQGNIKGVGVDCVMLMIEVYRACGLAPAVPDPRPYPHDWHMHRGEELYLGGIEQCAVPTAIPLPGDIALFQFGRCVSHGAIVLAWPLVIHAYIEHGAVVQTDVTKSAGLSARLRGFYCLKD
jgi:cell wall-associated NlpC family hydrolase